MTRYSTMTQNQSQLWDRQH